MTQSIQLQRHGVIAEILLNRPERRNALDLEMWSRLAEIMQGLNGEADLRCIIVRGAGGKAFGAGADISEFEQKRFSKAQAEDYAEVMHPALNAIAHSPHPVVALIEGACVGGGLELALYCDLRIANQSSKFGLPIKRLGNVLPVAGLRPLVQTVGRAVALEMLLEGRIMGAEEACAKGLVNRVLPDDEVEAEAFAAARRIAEGAPLAARLHKELTRRILEAEPLSEEEYEAPFALCDSADYQEGVRAFLEKREPKFKGE